jgi:hypothetical protein
MPRRIHHEEQKGKEDLISMICGITLPSFTTDSSASSSGPSGSIVNRIGYDTSQVSFVVKQSGMQALLPARCGRPNNRNDKMLPTRNDKEPIFMILRVLSGLCDKQVW